MSLSHIKGSCCFLEQVTLPSLFSTGWSQERNQAWFTVLWEKSISRTWNFFCTVYFETKTFNL